MERHTTLIRSHLTWEDRNNPSKFDPIVGQTDATSVNNKDKVIFIYYRREFAQSSIQSVLRHRNTL